MEVCSVLQQSIRRSSKNLAKVPMAMSVWIQVGCANHRGTLPLGGRNISYSCQEPRHSVTALKSQDDCEGPELAAVSIDRRDTLIL